MYTIVIKPRAEGEPLLLYVPSNTVLFAEIDRLYREMRHSVIRRAVVLPTQAAS